MESSNVACIMTTSGTTQYDYAMNECDLLKDLLNKTLGRNKGVIASSGNSELFNLPLERIVSLSRNKLSCLMVVLTSTFTLTLGLFKYA